MLLEQRILDLQKDKDALIDKVRELKNKVLDLELSLNSQRSINSRLITENNKLIQEIASIGNPIYLSITTFEADYPEPYSNVIRANCDDTWKDIEMSVKAKFLDDLYEQGYIKRVQNKDHDIQTLYYMRAVK